MNVSLFGGTGFVGTSVLGELLAAGHHVTALVRNPNRIVAHEGLTLVVGDAGDPAAVARAVAGTEAVISCLGTPRQEKQPVDFLASAMRNIIGAMERAGVERLIAISGAGVTLAGERKPFPHNAISALIRIVAHDVVAAKEQEFAALLSRPAIAWTAVRPTRVVDGSASGRIRVATESGKVGMRVRRGDLAQFMVGQLTDRSYLRQAPFVSN